MLAALIALVTALPGAAEAVEGTEGYFVRIFLGGNNAGDFITAKTTDGASRTWTLPTGEQVEGKKVVADFDWNFMFGVGGGGGINNQLSWIANISYTPGTSTAKVTTVANEVYDTKFAGVDILLIEGGIVLDWIDGKNTPYFGLGAGYSSLKFDSVESSLYDLDQNGFSFWFAGGYKLGPIYVELRDSIVQLNDGSAKQFNSLDSNVQINQSARIHLFQLTLGVQLFFN